ncbi:MAG TPA: hypothetical protein ENJ83_02405, partial [Rhodospirillales bacterium]|nr:hypothetical protein [Rhodospirillales bacterium]
MALFRPAATRIMVRMSATRFPSPLRVLDRLRRAVPGPYRRILPVALLLVVVAAVGPWLLRGQGPSENASAPVGGGVAEIPMPPVDALDGEGVPVPEPPPPRSLPSYAAVPRLALPRALAEAQPAPLRPRPRPRRRTERPPAGPQAADPVIALVLDDMGHNMETVRRAAALPAPMTLSFLPYVQDAPRRVAVA